MSRMSLVSKFVSLRFHSSVISAINYQDIKMLRTLGHMNTAMFDTCVLLSDAYVSLWVKKTFLWPLMPFMRMQYVRKYDKRSQFN